MVSPSYKSAMQKIKLVAIMKTPRFRRRLCCKAQGIIIALDGIVVDSTNFKGLSVYED